MQVSNNTTHTMHQLQNPLLGQMVKSKCHSWTLCCTRTDCRSGAHVFIQKTISSTIILQKNRSSRYWMDQKGRYKWKIPVVSKERPDSNVEAHQAPQPSEHAWGRIKWENQKIRSDEEKINQIKPKKICLEFNNLDMQMLFQELC